jgi:hypothetical protein
VSIFTEKYRPGDKIGGKFGRSPITACSSGSRKADGMVHKSDLSWTVKVTTRPTSTTRTTIESDHPSINHDEKKVSARYRSWSTIRGRRS